MNLNEAIMWLLEKGLKLLVGVTVLVLLYRGARPAIHRLVPTILHAQASALADKTTSSDEVRKRAVTLEDLLNTLARVLFMISLVVLILGVFDLWALIAGLALVIAAILVASQDVVLDYVMGVLILVEGPYFKGDWVVVEGQSGQMQGEVQEIGLRRTVLRDGQGNVFAVSNGLIRASSNQTRVFSVAVVEVQILHVGDLDRAIAIVSRAGRELQADTDWQDRVLADAPDTFVTALTADGASIKLQLRVTPGTGMAVSSEVRRRLAVAFTEASIGTARWDTALPIETRPADAGDGPQAPIPTAPKQATSTRPRARRRKPPEARPDDQPEARPESSEVTSAPPPTVTDV